MNYLKMTSMVFVALLAISSITLISSEADSASEIPEIYVTDGQGKKVTELIYSPEDLGISTSSTSAGTQYILDAGQELVKLSRCLYIDYNKLQDFKVGVKVQADSPVVIVNAGLIMTLYDGQEKVAEATVGFEETFFNLDSVISKISSQKELTISLTTESDAVSDDINVLKSPIRFVFTATTDMEMYTVKIVSNNSTYGTVSESKIENVPGDTTIHITNNKLMILQTTVTATPSEPSTWYTYSFDGWSVKDGSKVTQDMTITATFRAEEIPGPTPQPEHEEHIYHNEDGSTTYETIDRIPNPDGSTTVITSERTVGTDESEVEFEKIVKITETKYSKGKDYSEIKSELKDYPDGSETFDYVELNEYRDGSTAGTEKHTSSTPDGSYTSATTSKRTDKEGIYSYESEELRYTVLTDGYASYKKIDDNGSVTTEVDASNGDGTVTSDYVDGHIITTIESQDITESRMVAATEQIKALDGEKELTIEQGSKIYSGAYKNAGEANVMLRIQCQDGSMSIPAEVSAGLASSADFTTLTLLMKEGDDESLTPDQRKVTGDKAIIVELIDQTGKEIHELSGNVNIRFAYTIPEGKSADDMKVIYISESGQTEEMKHTYDQGYVEAILPHLSVYSVVFEEESPAEDEDNTILIAALVGLAAVIGVLAIIIIIRRSRS